MRDEDDALEVVQDCFLRIFRHLHRLQDSKKFGHWVSRLLVNQANTMRGKRKRQQTDELEDGFDDQEEVDLPLHGRPAPSPRKAAHRNEVFAKVNEAIQELPPRQRIAVLLFDVQNKSIKEIATELECSEGAVKFNIFQGRRKLRALLEEYVDGDGKLDLEG